MKPALIVMEAFGPYVRGDLITDPKAIKAVQASENAASVNRVQIPDSPADPAPQ